MTFCVDLEDAFEDSIHIVQKDTGLDLKKKLTLCTYTFDQCMDEAFFPEA